MFGMLSRAFRRSERARGDSSTATPTAGAATAATATAPGARSRTASASGDTVDTAPELRRIVPSRVEEEEQEQVTGCLRWGD